MPTSSTRQFKEPDYETFRLLVQEVKDYAIFMLDPKGRVLTWNAGAQRLKGYSEKEILGQSFSVFFTKEDIANKQPQRELEMAATEGRTENEGWRLRKDGTRFWANAVITALHNGNGKLRGFVKITRDLTERRRAEEALREQATLLERRVEERTAELERANRMKDEFITTLSHELRTPITSITGWVQMLEAGELTRAQQTKAFEVIDRNLVSQAQLIDDLLNVSRIVSGKMQLDMRLVYPAPLIEEAIDSLLPTAEAKKIKLTRDLDAGIGPMKIDPPRFHQILWNLLTNALKFTPNRGHIHVSLKRVNSHALLQVSDSGEGIDSEFLPYIFDRFRQMDASRSRKHGGLGVGLTIVKYLVELHGATIYAESPGLGKGSTFNIDLPIPGLTLGAGSGSKQTAQGKASLKGTRILLVEDEADTRDMLAQALKQQGAKPVQAGSAKQALELLKKERIDLLISDVGMPEIDGYQFMQQLRSMKPSISQVPAVALTAYAGEEDRKLSIAAGFNAHLPKPISLTELVRVAGKLVSNRRKSA